MKEERWSEAIKLLKGNSALLEKDWELLWNLGWSYFKLERISEARRYLIKATKLAPESHACKFALGSVFLKKKQYKKAESILADALRIKDSDLTRMSLAMAYQAQGKTTQAENTHLDGIKLKPKASERYAAYADFLSDIGREAESERMNRKAREIRRIN